MENNVIIYSTPTCVYCKAAKEFFTENNVEFTEKYVAADMEAQKEMIKKSGGQMAVPVIDVNGQISIGFDKGKLSEQLGIN